MRFAVRPPRPIFVFTLCSKNKSDPNVSICFPEKTSNIVSFTLIAIKTLFYVFFCNFVSIFLCGRRSEIYSEKFWNSFVLSKGSRCLNYPLTLMENLATFLSPPFDLYILKVNDQLCRENKKAYELEMLTIGPYHRY